MRKYHKKLLHSVLSYFKIFVNLGYFKVYCKTSYTLFYRCVFCRKAKVKNILSSGAFIQIKSHKTNCKLIKKKREIKEII